MACGVPLNKESVTYPSGLGDTGIRVAGEQFGACRSDATA